MQIERRFTATSAPAVKGKTITGTAAVFNRRSDNLGTPDHRMHEIILPGAFDDVILDDVIACFNHDEKLILARSRDGTGTLSLWVDKIALRYSFEAPDTTTGRDTLESIARGDVNSSSFAFQVAPGGDSYAIQPDGSTLRTITKIGRLFDVSPVIRPAYAAATVSARGAGTAAQETPGLNCWERFMNILR